MKVCVLQPDYRASEVDYRHYDPTRDLAPLLPGHEVRHLALDKRLVFRQLQQAAREGFDVFVNLCEGYPDWDIPSIDVIHALEQLDLPYTGPSPDLYDPAKAIMKYVAYVSGVATPRHLLVSALADLAPLRAVPARGPAFPLFVKPAHAGDSRGVDEGSRVTTLEALEQRVQALLPEFPTLLVEEYVDGPEYTVLVVATPDGGVRAFRPIEYDFGDGPRFKTYALKTSELHPDANRPVADPVLAARLQDAATRIFRAFHGHGYARLDFRAAPDGTLHFLEINFTCSVFYPPGAEGSADHVLRHDGIGQAGFLALIIAEGIARHQRRQPLTEIRGDALAGYGTFARRAFAPGDLVFHGEEQPFALATLPHVMRHWSAEARREFRRYAYPIGPGVYALWSSNPEAWRPQNHSCDPNTGYRGLDVVALRPIAAGEELTLDYGTFLDERAEPFTCACGAATCRGEVRGTPGTSVSARLAADGG